MLLDLTAADLARLRLSVLRDLRTTTTCDPAWAPLHELHRRLDVALDLADRVESHTAAADALAGRIEAAS